MVKRPKDEKLDEMIAQGLRIGDLPASSRRSKSEEGGDAKQRKAPGVLSYNLGVLLDRNQVHPHDAPEKIGVDRRWFKRLLKEGIHQKSSRTTERMEKIAKFFKIKLEDLWSADLEKTLPRLIKKDRVLSYRKGKYWPVAEQLMTLLENERFHYLIQLVGELYAYHSEEIAKTWTVRDEPQVVSCPRCKRRVPITELEKYSSADTLKCKKCFYWSASDEEEDEGGDNAPVRPVYNPNATRCSLCRWPTEVEELMKYEGRCKECADTQRALADDDDD